VNRLVQLVADYGPGELRFGGTVGCLSTAVPGLFVCAVQVAPGDTLAAGLCVAELALGPGAVDRLVVHDVDGDVGDGRLWTGRTRQGVLVVGADRGWAWSFVAGGLRDLIALDVPAVAGLGPAVRHALSRHPHAAAAVVARDRIPSAPDCVLVWTDRAGNLQTTLDAAPAQRVMVRIGDRTARARCGPAPAAGELVLEPGARGLRRLAVGGGSASERFGAPPAGTPVSIAPLGRRGRSGAGASRRP
jgi:hypothetical protein